MGAYRQPLEHSSFTALNLSTTTSLVLPLYSRMITSIIMRERRLSSLSYVTLTRLFWLEFPL